MFCPNCRNQVVDGAEFCNHCGTHLKQIQRPSNKGRNTGIILLLIIVIIVLVVVFLFGVKKFRKKDSTPNDNQQMQENNNTNNTGTVDPGTNLTYDKNGAFLMNIEDSFTITGRGTVVTGKVARGTVHLNDEVQIIGLDKEIKTTTVTAIEMFRQSKESAEAGDNVGILLKDASLEDVLRGQVLAQPNSIKATKKFEASVSLFSKEEGGQNIPLFSNYKLLFYIRNTNITGVITLSNGVEMVMPGSKDVKVTVELDRNVALEVGTEFALRNSGQKIGEGIVTNVD